MKKRSFIALTIFIFLMLPQIANACWAYLTVDELVERSDVILIGEVVDRLGGSMKADSVNYNKWKVRVHYYIKGETKDSEVIVGTPDERTSLHYDLNANGDQVLLFLRQDGSYYLTHSPQAMVAIAFDQNRIEVGKDISGEKLLEWMEINNQNISPEDQEELEKYLSSRELISGVDPGEINNSVQKDIKTIGGFAFVGVSSMIFFIMRKK
ncbi:hypothetical protein [Anaerosolibacter sp.]|uniref:hypothetical protein n=1 Tax=Anaerosolibacter sp. TaxID=1872527 RepID=UPI0039EF4577